MVQNLWRVQFQGGDCPPPEELRGGTKNFSGASRPICPPPELNPVSATVYIYIYISGLLKVRDPGSRAPSHLAKVAARNH